MGSLGACAQIRREHYLMEDVVGGIEELMVRRREGMDVPTPPIVGAIEFFTAFVDRCHEVKEAEGLCPVLEAAGLPDRTLPIALQAEHDEGRRLLRDLRGLSADQRLDEKAWTALGSYLALLRRHMASEASGLLPLAERLLSAEADAVVLREFDRIEERSVGSGGAEVLFELGRAVSQAARAQPATPVAEPHHLVARDVMRGRPVIVAPGDSLARATALMESVGTRELPVVANGMLVGILSRSDLEPHRGHYEWTTVRTAMTPDPVTVVSQTPVHAVARLLHRRGFNAVPVVTGDRLVGMVRRSDVLRVLI